MLYKAYQAARYASKPSYRALQMRRCHTTALTVFSPHASLEAKTFFEALLAPEGRTLSELVLLNHHSDNVHMAQYMLIEDDKVKLVFNTGISEQYRFWAKLLYMTEEERSQVGIPGHIPMPVDVKNLTWCGGGAYVDFDRKEVIEFIKQQMTESKKRGTTVLLSPEKACNLRE